MSNNATPCSDKARDAALVRRLGRYSVLAHLPNLNPIFVHVEIFAFARV